MVRRWKCATENGITMRFHRSAMDECGVCACCVCISYPPFIVEYNVNMTVSIKDKCDNAWQ